MAQEPISFISISQFCREMDISPSTYYRGVADGRFPAPVSVGPNSRRIIHHEAEAAKARVIAARDAGATKAA